VTCRFLGCPRPDAVAQILEDHESEHVVEFGEWTFTVRHPLRERLDDELMRCELHQWIADLSGPPVQLGRYRAVSTMTEVDPTENWVFTRIDATEGDLDA
jgi:hypothetical protein